MLKLNSTNELLEKLIDITSKQISENFILLKRVEILENKVSDLEEKFNRIQGSVIVITDSELQKWATGGTD